MGRFDSVSETFAPVEDGTADRCFISESYDATRFVRGGGVPGFLGGARTLLSALLKTNCICAVYSIQFQLKKRTCARAEGGLPPPPPFPTQRYDRPPHPACQTCLGCRSR